MIQGKSSILLKEKLGHIEETRSPRLKNEERQDN